MIVVTDDFYGGETGFNSILNDYYENAINDLPEKDRIKARRFIEEGLIVGERRVGMTEGVEKNRYDIDEELLEILLDSRLVRAEITHLGRSYEVSHDTLIEPIVRSKKARQEREEREKRQAELRKTRRRYLIASAIALFGITLSIASTYFYIQANQAKEAADIARKETQKNYDELIERIFDNAKIKYDNAVALGDTLLEAERYTEAKNAFDSALDVYNEYKVESELEENEGYKPASDIDPGAQRALAGSQEAASNVNKEDLFQNLQSEFELYLIQEGLALRSAERVFLKIVALEIKGELVRTLRIDLNGKIRNQVQKYLNDGNYAIQRSNYAKACEAFRNALSLRPGTKLTPVQKAAIDYCREDGIY